MPYSLYGHLLLQSFLASHLVVDTGMNYFGMPLEAARSYMRAHTFESDVEIEAETLVYSTDIYAHAVSHWLGYEKFWEPRHRTEHALGTRFGIRKSHAAAIDEGSMTLDVLTLTGSLRSSSGERRSRTYRGTVRLNDCHPRWTAWKDRTLERPAVQRAIAREGIGVPGSLPGATPRHAPFKRPAARPDQFKPVSRHPALKGAVAAPAYF